LKDAAGTVANSDSFKVDVRAFAVEMRTALASDRSLRQAIKEALGSLGTLRTPSISGASTSSSTADETARQPVRVLFEKGSTVIAMQPHAPLRELTTSVRQKFQIPDELELEWTTHDGATLDAAQSLASQLRESDWQRPGARVC
jgi:hypothetical protein